MDLWKCRVQQRSCILVPHHKNPSLNVKTLSSSDKTAATAASTLIPLARLTVTSVTKSLSRFSLAFKSNLSQSLPGFLATLLFLRTTENTLGRSSAWRKSKMFDLSCLMLDRFWWGELVWFKVSFIRPGRPSLCYMSELNCGERNVFLDGRKTTISDSAALIAKLNHFFFRLEFLSSEWNVLFRNRYHGPAAHGGGTRVRLLCHCWKQFGFFFLS